MQMQEPTDVANDNNSNNKLTSHTPVPNVPVVNTRVQLGVGQAFAYQGTTRGSLGAQIPFNLHHGAHPVNIMPVNTPSGVPRSLHPSYNVRHGWRSFVSNMLIKLAH